MKNLPLLITLFFVTTNVHCANTKPTINELKKNLVDQVLLFATSVTTTQRLANHLQELIPPLANKLMIPCINYSRADEYRQLRPALNKK